MKRPALALLAALVCSLNVARADVQLPKIFADHMVLQRNAKIPVWGTAEAGEKVIVRLGTQSQSATSDGQGKWRVVLDPIESKDALELTVTGKNTITVKDVLLGEVWVCAGQSNMVFGLKHATGGAEAIKSADRPKIRLFTVGRQIAPDAPKDDLADSKWDLCTPETIADFSAVAYFFGRDIQDKFDGVPIGLIEAAWGGTRAEAWIPRPVFDALKLPYEPAWTEQWLNPKQNPNAKTPTPSRPHEAPAALFNGMIHPLAGYAIRGVIWYQGETNTAYGEQYGDVLGALVKSWRAAWGQGDIPFLIVQLPNVVSKTRFWPITRAGQARVAKEQPNVGLAITIDGDSNDLHPPNKLPVAKRLVLLAQRLAYGMAVPTSGPTFESMKVDSGDVTITFDHLEGGLVSKEINVGGFELAGDDGKFVPAVAKIEGDTVVVSADGVATPKAVRYGWQNDPKCTLYNKVELPAAPFEATAP